MGRLFYFSMLVAAGAIGLMIGSAPQDISDNACLWFAGAGISCSDWVRAALAASVAPIVIYSLIAALVSIPLLSLGVSVFYVYRRKKIPKSIETTGIAHSIAKTWAETGTWTPSFSFGCNNDVQIEIISAEGRYWNFGKYVEINGDLKVQLRYSSVPGKPEIGGLPFTATLYGTPPPPINVECESSAGWSRTFVGLIKKNSTSVILKATADDFPPNNTYYLHLVAFYESG